MAQGEDEPDHWSRDAPLAAAENPLTECAMPKRNLTSISGKQDGYKRHAARIAL
jgi:hypothetical protein